MLWFEFGFRFRLSAFERYDLRDDIILMVELLMLEMKVLFLLFLVVFLIGLYFVRVFLMFLVEL